MTGGISTNAASLLCAECGLCCNGVMFHKVRLQPGDSPRELVALGMKLKRKKKEYCIQQPCPAHRGSHCSIYPARPERCRVFECRQLKRIARGETSVEVAMGRIREVQKRVAELEDLLCQAGVSETHRPLVKRCADAAAGPLDATLDAVSSELRSRITLAMGEVDAMLDAEFRNEPAADT